MLKSLRITNFKSYKDEAYFSFEGLKQDALSGNYTDMHLNNGEVQRLLHSAVVFGANASGKTNILWALAALQYLVTKSRGFEYNDTHDLSMPYEPFAFDDAVSNKPTEITVELIVDNSIYKYFVSYDRRRIILERLSLLYGEEEINCFTVKMSEKGKKIIQPGKVIDIEKLNLPSFDLLPNHLLLSELGVKPSGVVLSIYNELASMQIEPSAESSGMKKRNRKAANEILKNEKSKLFKQLRKLVRIADVGIEDIFLEKETDDSGDYYTGNSDKFRLSQTFLKMQTLHKGYDNNHNLKVFRTSLDDFESMGTNHLFNLGARVLQVLDTGGFLAYDEMNLALHPSLLALLVGMFNNPKSNPKHAQLVFTTHDATVVGDNQMRVDQVWFTEKNENGESEIFSAQDFDDISIVAPIEQWYRSGLFGARPILGSIDVIFEENE